MKTRWIVAVAGIILAALAVRSRNPSGRTTMPPATPNPPVAVPTLPKTQSTPDASATTGNPPPAAVTSQPAEQLPSEVLPRDVQPLVAEVRGEIESVQFAMRDYRTTLGENPIGNNAEITKALLGDNLKQVKIPIPTGSTVNGDGELCDRWGTPYFFHQLSARVMEIRSAGADRTLWTGDDVVTK